MARKLLIDASHTEEVRVAIVNEKSLEEFDSQTTHKKILKGNIYLAKVMRVEPSLQAAFVEYGNGRQGFLPFSEIHPDYYQIPVADRERILENQPEENSSPNLDQEEESLLPVDLDSGRDDDLTVLAESNTEELSSSITEAEVLPPVDESEGDIDADAPKEDQSSLNKKRKIRGRKSPHKNNDDSSESAQPKPYQYKIQEVIKRRQILLVQVIKEERGNKGAAVTTYLSLAGRYCVLMPNAGRRNGGVSRKIDDAEDRSRLKELISSLSIPEGMSLIIRTAGQEKRKTEIKRDYDYLLGVWSRIRDLTLKSIAPALIHEEGDLITRALRDMYDTDIDQILIEGDEAYKQAKNLMKMMIPSHAKRVVHYKNPILPLFHAHNVEEQIDQVMNPVCPLPSGGYIVINSTEALVAIDVNSGKSTRERHIDETALKTNIEAAEEVAKQLRLRDLAGLVVIDFIDMHDSKHVQQVERRFREATRLDRARIQVGRISQFGLLEMSRQRLKPSLIENHATQCQHCHGSGFVRSIESSSLQVLRALEGEAVKGNVQQLLVQVPADVDLYLLNQKRNQLVQIETRFGLKILIERDLQIMPPLFNIDVIKNSVLQDVENIPVAPVVEEKIQPSQAIAKPKKIAQPKKIVEQKVVSKDEPAAQEETTKDDGDKKGKKRSNRYNRYKLRRARNDSERQVEGAENNKEPIEPKNQEVDLKEPKKVNPAKNKNIRDKKDSDLKPEIIHPKENVVLRMEEVVEVKEPAQIVEEKKVQKSKKNKSWLRRLLEA